MQTVREKYGFTNEEIETFLILFRQDLQVMKKRRLWLFENLPPVLGIEEKDWAAVKGRRHTKRCARIVADFMNCQIGKRVIFHVILDTLEMSGPEEEQQREAFEKVKMAINYFEPIPILRPWNAAGKIDEVHKEWAERLYQQELQRVERVIGLHIWQNIDD